MEGSCVEAAEESPVAAVDLMPTLPARAGQALLRQVEEDGDLLLLLDACSVSERW